VPSGHQNYFGKTQKRKLEKLKRDSVKLHAERKCASGPRLISLPKLRRDNVLICTDEIRYIKARRRIKGRGL
jgi:hypothetical protein